MEKPRAAGGTGVRGRRLGCGDAGGELELVRCRTVQRITGFTCTPTVRAVWIQIEARCCRTSCGSNTATDGGFIGARAQVAGNEATCTTIVAGDTRVAECPVADRVVVVTPSANAYFGAGLLVQL